MVSLNILDFPQAHLATPIVFVQSTQNLRMIIGWFGGLLLASLVFCHVVFH